MTGSGATPSGQDTCGCGHEQAAHDRVLSEPGTLGFGPCGDCRCLLYDGPIPPAPVQETCDLRDEKGNYLGKVGTSAEHRTIGDYRAWCHDCGEWCYPTSPCGEPKCCAELSTPLPPAPAQEAPIDSSLIAAHDATADQTPQEAGSGRHVQSTARNLTFGPGMSSRLDGGRQAAVEAVAQKLAEWTASHRYWIKAGEPEREAYRDDARELLDLPAVAALSQPGEPT